jgi:hypothetical protein
MRAAYSCAVAVAAAALVAACGDASTGDAPSVTTKHAPAPGVSVDRLEPRPGIGGDGSYVDAPFPKLSDYALVSIEDAKIVFAPGVVPYDVRNPLFTDYATKSRAIYVPPGAKVHYDAARPFTLPLGAIVVKSFGYGSRWIETRLLVQSRDGLRGYAYVWDEQQREATLQPGGAVITTESGSTHLVPNQNQCVKCHGDSTTVVPIGLKREQLDHGDQLARWTKLGILEGAPPASGPPIPAYGDPSSCRMRSACARRRSLRGGRRGACSSTWCRARRTSPSCFIGCRRRSPP